MATINFNKKRIGLQLYSLREQITTLGLETVLSKISAAGYNSLEMYGFNTKDGYFKKSAEEVAALLKTNKIISPSGHYNFELFDNDTQQTVDAALALGHSYIVIPSIPEGLRKSADDFKAVSERLNKLGLYCKKNNIKLAYHNHAFEFTKFEDGMCGFDIIMKETDKALVNFEMDLFWVITAGQDPIELFKRHPGRFKMWHVKDMNKINPKLNTEIGSGSINFKSIFKKAKLSGMEYFYVEQENFSMDVYESIKKSNLFVKTII